jgi:Protein of unknown function (DUF4231)
MSAQLSRSIASKQELEQLIDVLELSDLQKKYMRSRWLEQAHYMSLRARQTHNWYYRLRMTAIIGSVIVPIMLGIQQPKDGNAKFDLHWLTIGLSGVVAISVAVEEFFHYGDRRRHFRQTAESLKSQGWQFSQLSGLYSIYPSHQAAFPSFTTYVETLLQNENEMRQFKSEVQQVLMAEDKVLRKELDSQGIFWVCD